MSDRNPNLNKPDENAGSITTSQPYSRSEGTSTSARLTTDENAPTITPQPNAQPASKAMNPVLTRALVGGLVGATLGTLAGVLAGKRTARGVNHAVKGVGDATKTIAGGVSQTAKGVGDAVKSVAEGVNYTVVGAIQDTTEGVNQVVAGALDAIKDTAEDAKPSVRSAFDAAMDTAEDAKQAVVGALDAVENTAEEAKPSEYQSDKTAKERLIIDAPQVNTGEVGIGEQVGTQTGTISPMERARLANQTIDVNPETPVTLSEADFCEGQDAGINTFEKSADI